MQTNEQQFLSDLLPEVVAVAKEAGAGIRKIYQQANIDVELKADNSPLTEADLLANKIICHGLQKLTPDYPIVSEEGENCGYEQRKSWQRFWLVDPLDGTKEFIARTDEFTVNIALIENNKPILGVVYVPVLQESYWGIKGGAAFWEVDGEKETQIKVSEPPAEGLRIAVSRRHGSEQKLKEILAGLGNINLVHVGSTLKICLIARGLVDVYPRPGRTCEWDTAAGHCILNCAGGEIIDFNEKPLRYNTRQNFHNPEFFAYGASQIVPKLKPLLKLT